MDLNIFSFFSGSGFLDLGFERNGYNIVLVNEFSDSFQQAYRYARSKMGLVEPRFGYTHDVNYFLTKQGREALSCYVDIVRNEGNLVGFIGGPPCPDFSVAGKQRGREGDNGKLSQSYVDVICDQQPDFFLFENVKGLWRTAKHRAYYDELKVQLGKNYYLTDRLCNSLEFGAPQDRDRILLFGVQKSFAKSRGLDIGQFPWNAHIIYNMERIKAYSWPKEDPFEENVSRVAPIGVPVELTVQYWFDKNDVLSHPNANDYFQPRAGITRMRTIPEGDDAKKSYKRLHRWRYSPTVAYGNNEVHLHPYKTRRISAAEALSLQSLPREFCLPPEMSLTDKFKTIGNGVPFLLASGIAASIKDFLKK